MPKLAFANIPLLLVLLLAACGYQSTRTDAVPAKLPPESAPVDEAREYQSSAKLDWGEEITLDQIVQLARNGQIHEIQWHVMPNIIRAQALDNRIFHLKNENKGVDVRKVLEESGILIGEGGITFRYLF